MDVDEWMLVGSLDAGADPSSDTTGGLTIDADPVEKDAVAEITTGVVGPVWGLCGDGGGKCGLVGELRARPSSIRDGPSASLGPTRAMTDWLVVTRVKCLSRYPLKLCGEREGGEEKEVNEG